MKLFIVIVSAIHLLCIVCMLVYKLLCYYLNMQCLLFNFQIQCSQCGGEESEMTEFKDFSVDLSTLFNIDDDKEIESEEKLNSTMERHSIEREEGGENEKTTLSSNTFSDANSTSIDYEDIESIESSCQLRRYTYQPRGLNNIYNEYTRVVNNGSFTQSITIEQCL
jgi:hypothetical protein